MQNIQTLCIRKSKLVNAKKHALIAEKLHLIDSGKSAVKTDSA
jgi:hypothetical protein